MENMNMRDIVDRIERGESVPIDDVEQVVGPLPRTKDEARAELVRMTGLSIKELERLTGRDLS